MKNYRTKFLTLSLLLIITFFYSQKNIQVETDKSIVNEYNATILQAQKKAENEEKMKFPKPYNDKENAEAKIAELVKRAQKENKNIILQAGGNWCIWCLRFNNFVQTIPELKEIVDDNYLYYHLNYSPENKNSKIFMKYGNPGDEYGYPVFIVLNKDGKQIHTQDSSVLEEGKGYSLERVKAFFKEWSPKP
jgi:thioredoxin-related protein